MERVIVIGGGLAGCEAAWQLARREIRVVLYEMKPRRFSPAHRSPNLAELVCSNSLKPMELTTAHGLLKEEMRRLDSIIVQEALKSQVPAGTALAVDREEFSRRVTERLESIPHIEIIREEVTQIPPEGYVILATGPLTSEGLMEAIARLTKRDYLHFYDATSPIVTADSIDFEKAFRGSRYGKGGGDYINCPMTKEEYYRFVDELLRAEKVPFRDFEKVVPYEGCMPIEDMAQRGRDALAFGPLRPVGLLDPRTGRRPYAVVQLRPENRERTLYNMVGFQTKLKYPEQDRVFRLIPGLERAEFVRYGSVHLNAFIDAPRLLDEFLRLRGEPRILFAGQITGVEGYVESAATGLLAGINVSRMTRGLPLVAPPPTTALGALISHITNQYTPQYQPMGVNFGLFPPLEDPPKKKGERRAKLVERALRDLENWIRELGEVQ
ncbi:MAG: methylenetetrahydrofolate--tRNA-(uracil(54)-C(5))-methyltransferase (FADH(2)-oxidizing) TrmFO [Deltaproteobacteria bacterium]|nr:MAG: methylenetetrahydrofolate--tRNA-(uracil(54)-C(5))-methyltransferase (FADH(2)-oxidizing) TrmFO [Deltaproteobacteria bacterium]